MLDGAERKRFRSLAATLNHMTLDRSDVQYATELEEIEVGRQICERCRKGDVGDAGVATRRDGG